MFICMVVPLFLTSKSLCSGGFQITLFDRSGKEWFPSLELASNSCLEPSGSQLPEQRSPVRLVLLKHAKTNQSMFDRDACRRLPSVFISRIGFIFRYASGFSALSLCVPPSLPLFLSFSSFPSLLFRRLSLSLSFFLSLSISLSLFSLVSLFSLSLSLSLSLFSLSLSLSLSLPLV